MNNIIAKIQELYKTHGHDIWAVFCILLAGAIGYNLGRVGTFEKLPISFGQDATILNAVNNKDNQKDDRVFRAGENSAAIPSATPRDPRVVVSKASSSKKYHYSWCSSWKKIKPENQVWYANEKAAQGAGYTLAGNCQ